MSVTIEPMTQTLQERSAAATRRFCDALGLGEMKPANLKYLTLALADVAADEISRDSGFGERVRAAYEQLVREYSPPKPSKGVGKTVKVPGPKKEPKPKLVPVGNVDPARFAAYTPGDPYALLDLYGDHQLRTALASWTVAELKNASAMVEQRNPGTKPKSKGAKAPLIDYIVEQLAGAGF